MLKKKTAQTVYQRLYDAYGPQHWWPADSAFEVMVGAVLTQNTAWKNVEQAIANLRQGDYLDLQRLLSLSPQKLAGLIRPSGYFNIKAQRLRNLCLWLQAEGGIKVLAQHDTSRLRNSLQTVNGVGPETADDILLYAFARPVFVIDVYTRRLFARLGLITGAEPYETLRGYFETALPADVPLYNEYHALIVRHAKERCVDTEQCRHCGVERYQGSGIRGQGSGVKNRRRLVL
jgi:endonuclease-3 related protein